MFVFNLTLITRLFYYHSLLYYIMVRARTAYKSVSFQVIFLASSYNFAFVPTSYFYSPGIYTFQRHNCLVVWFLIFFVVIFQRSARIILDVDEYGFTVSSIELCQASDMLGVGIKFCFYIYLRILQWRCWISFELVVCLHFQRLI